MWDYERAKRSSNVFDLVIPTLEKHFGGKIYSTESEDSAIAKILDRGCSIDGIVVSNMIFGIAHRVNYKSYETFTVRIKDVHGLTELQHITRPGIKPRYHVQTIVENDMPVKLAITKTDSLIECINRQLGRRFINQLSFDEFYSIKWQTLIDNGYDVDIIDLVKE